MSVNRALPFDVSRETSEKLQAYENLIRKWSPKINLVSRADLSDLWCRHIIDSAQIYPLAPIGPQMWCDLGSGGGLPGVVLSILASDAAPQSKFTLIESDQRKATFLRTAIRELGLSGHVLTDRIEVAEPQVADIVTARALAPLPALLPLVARHLAPGGTAFLPKGENASEEIEAARANWHFLCEAHPSSTNARARILQVKDIRRVS